MSTGHKLRALVATDLTGFTIREMTEVYRTDVDGRKTRSLGFFKDPTVATAFAGAQVDANYHKTKTALVLTDGKVGYVIEQEDPVTLFDDEAETLKLKEHAIGKLTEAERILLGLFHQ